MSFLSPKKMPQIQPVPAAQNLFTEPTPIYLKVLDLFRGFLTKRGYDYDQLRLILQVKMVSNSRDLYKNAAAQGMNQTGKKPMSFNLSLVIQAAIGLFSSVFLILPVPVALRYNIVLTMILLMTTVSLVGQLSVILLNHEDLLVLPIRPINPRSLSLARIIQVMIYQVSGFLTYCVPSMVVSFIVFGPWIGLTAVVSMTLMSIFMLLLALALYLLAARHFSGEKLRDMITYAQILLMVFNFVGYQSINFMTRAVEGLQIESFTPHPILLLLPSFWFASPMALLHDGYHLIYAIGIALMLVSTLLLALYYHRTSPILEQRLITLAQDKGEAIRERTGYRNLMSRIFCRSDLERSFFNFSWQMLRNERNLKIALYPSLVMGNLFPYIMLVQILAGDEEVRQSGFPVYVGVYLVLGFITTSVTISTMSDYYQAGWIFDLLPESHDGAYARGHAKALFVRFVLPFMPVHMIALGFIAGPNGIAGAVNLTCISLVMLIVANLTMKIVRPFTQQRLPNAGSQGCGAAIIAFLIAGLFAGLQILVDLAAPLNLVYTGIVVLVAMYFTVFFRGDRTYPRASER